jgi:phosphatidylinositol alpha-1,6-mannosyltransferase
LAGALGVADSAVFAGTVSHEALPAHYQHAALLVFPSVAEEGLGLVVIEAMGCGCPVLISDLPALADVVIDGQTGFLFPQGDHAKLALRLDELMRQPALRTAVAERGREAILSHFDWSVVGENYRTLYDELRQQQDGDDS